MNFLDALPRQVTLAGRAYPIYTDFRDWINFERLLRDKSLSDSERAALMLDWFSGEPPPPVPDLFESLFAFFLCGGNPPKNEKNPKPVFDYEQDMPNVYAGFIQSYSINLLQIEYLHWWEFRSLLDGLPEDTRLSKIMGYRAIDVSKLPKSERERYRELQRIYALRGNKQQSALSLEDRNREMIERAKDARRRAEIGGMSSL